MKKIIDTQQTADPNVFGETLREYAFVEDYGCYTCFDLLPEFEEVEKDSDIGLRLLVALGCDEQTQKETEKLETDADNRAWVRASFEEEREGCQMFSNGEIHVCWHWDGDGTLIFIESDRGAINTDCKKDYNWHWLN